MAVIRLDRLLKQRSALQKQTFAFDLPPRSGGKQGIRWAKPGGFLVRVGGERPDEVELQCAGELRVVQIDVTRS